MSSDSLAMFRRSLGPELAELAEQHYQHDLRQSDREALQAAARTARFHASFGSAVGVSLGLVLAFRLRRGRARMFRTLRGAEQPRAVRFADGREEALPDLRPLLRTTTLGDVATYLLLGAGGLFFGGELGLLSGGLRARQNLAQDRASRERIRTALRRFQADSLRARADALDQGREGNETRRGRGWETWL